MNTTQELHQKIKSPDGVDIAYSIRRYSGARYTLVMLHGLASNLTRWSEFSNHTELASRMNLLRLDLRGHGNSMSYGSIGHHLWQQDLQAILQKESVEEIILVGHSMGAQLAMHYTVSQPERVRGLVLIDPTLPKKLKGPLAVARRLRYPLLIVITLMRLFNQLTHRQRIYPQRDLYILDKKTRQLMASESAGIIAELYTSPKEDLKYMPLVNYLQDVYASTGPLPDLSKIKCPVKVLLSKDSSIVDPANIKDYFAPGVPVEISEINANHWPLTEKPEETRQVIDQWCLHQIT